MRSIFLRGIQSGGHNKAARRRAEDAVNAPVVRLTTSQDWHGRIKVPRVFFAFATRYSQSHASADHRPTALIDHAASHHSAANQFDGDTINRFARPQNKSFTVWNVALRLGEHKGVGV